MKSLGSMRLPSDFLSSRARRFALASALSFVVPGLVVLACSTDNGDNFFGPDIGSLPKRDANVPDGKIMLPDGAIVDDPDAADPEQPDPECLEGTVASGTIAVLAGDDGKLGGATKAGSAAWKAETIARGAAKSRPALTTAGGRFVGVVHGAGDALQTTTFGSCWTGAKDFGTAGVKGPPTLAPAGTGAHLVYSAGPGANTDFHHGVHDGTAFNAATATVGDRDAMTLSFGTGSAALSAVGSEIVFAQNGTDDGAAGGGLYVRSFSSNAWASPAPVTGIGTIGDTLPAGPQLVTLDGATELLLVYVEKDTRRLAFATRTGGAWSPKGAIHTDLNAAEAFSLAALGGNKVLLALRGQDGNGYFIMGTVNGSTVDWPTGGASSIGGGGTVAVDTAPAVARGVGGDEAVMAYASGGAVNVKRLQGGTWSAPENVTGLSGSRVAIATR